jgi:hypothetical protein
MRFDLLLQLGRKILCLDETHPIQQKITGDRIPIIRSLDFLDTPEIPQPILVPVRLAEFGSRTIILRLDSGAAAPIFFKHRLVVTAYTLTRWRRAQVAGNARDFTILPAQDLGVGKHQLRNLVFAAPVKIIGTPTFQGEDGLLPIKFFERRVYQLR